MADTSMPFSIRVSIRTLSCRPRIDVQARLPTCWLNSSISDFEIDGKTFEVGGRNKKQKQIQNAAQGYIVKDDIETGYANIIPLWQFGLTY